MESLLALLVRRHIDIRFSSLVLVDLVLLVLSGFLGIFFWLVCFTWSILFHVVVCRLCPPPPPPPPPPCCWVYNEIMLAIPCLFVFLGLESLAWYYSTIPFMSTSFSPLRCVCVCDGCTAWEFSFSSKVLPFKKGNEKKKQTKKEFSNQKI
jgi:hypothetical protein